MMTYLNMDKKRIKLYFNREFSNFMLIEFFFFQMLRAGVLQNSLNGFSLLFATNYKNYTYF